ncbi:MAG: type II toxin-antitoxin system VapC family toxin [Bifidobacteriaceae bacterium]|jgi:PIN domain nuclease of toxin-antitoxin system|nr:type II toxin-antitoxin system VapC family toxin [Bifidobacteriaceae bacterium]
MTSAYLVDTHILLWALNDPDRLPARVLVVLRDPEVEVFFSPVSLWEVAVKHSLGKIDLAGHSPEELLAVTLESGLLPLEVTAQVCASSQRLPRRHKDPFDRLIVWQAIQSGIALLSADQALGAYVEDGLSLVG